MMEPQDVLFHMDRIVTESKVELPDTIATTNFLDYADIVRDIVLDWSSEKKSDPRIIEFAEGLRRMRDNWDEEVALDPLLQYRPAHKVAEEFHQSLAWIVQYRGGNRISKTESARADNHAVVTGRKWYREIPPLPAAIFIVGTDYQHYLPSVFEKKYLYGEAGNPLTPAFPESGRWFHRYDRQKHIIYIACPECAAANKSKQCIHLKSTIQLFSDQVVAGEDAIAGGQYSQGQFDEHVSRLFFSEAKQRLKSVPRSRLAVTYTPLKGKAAWQHQELTLLYEKGPPENLIPGTDRLITSLHTIDQFSAGLVDHALIMADMVTMSPAEAEARIWGRPAAYSETAVFDPFELAEMYNEVEKGTKGFLLQLPDPDDKEQAEMDADELLEVLEPGCDFEFVEDEAALLTIFKEPTDHGQYVIGADVAKGLRGGDYSCGDVYEITRKGLNFIFEQVAQYHGHVNPEPYADDLMRMAVYYNDALLVPERRGPGDRTIQRLKQLGYWHIFQDEFDPSGGMSVSPDALLGVDTNVKSKGILVSVLQHAIKDKVTGRRTIIVRSFLTLEQFGHYGQQTTEKGTVTFRGEGGYKDDAVIGPALAIYAVKSFPELYDMDKEQSARAAKRKEQTKTSDEEFWGDVHEEMKEDARNGYDPY